MTALTYVSSGELLQDLIEICIVMAVAMLYILVRAESKSGSSVDSSKNNSLIVLVSLYVVGFLAEEYWSLAVLCGVYLCFLILGVWVIPHWKKRRNKAKQSKPQVREFDWTQ